MFVTTKGCHLRVSAIDFSNGKRESQREARMYDSRLLRITVESPRAKHEDPRAYDDPSYLW